MIEKIVTPVAPITIEDDGTVIWREKVSIVEDGVEISHSYNHRQLSPGDDYSNESDQIKNIISGSIWETNEPI